MPADVGIFVFAVDAYITTIVQLDRSWLIFESANQILLKKRTREPAFGSIQESMKSPVQIEKQEHRVDIKVEIYLNRIVVEYDGEQRTFTPERPFSNTRMLVADFTAAERCLRHALAEMKVFGIFNFLQPKLCIHPKEKTEGGLSEVEKRILVEVGRGAGAKKVEIVIDGKAVVV
jgi:rod shape-determining protein MreB and related proteins